jgi:hypothetical protein
VGEIAIYFISVMTICPHERILITLTLGFNRYFGLFRRDLDARERERPRRPDPDRPRENATFSKRYLRREEPPRWRSATPSPASAGRRVIGQNSGQGHLPSVAVARSFASSGGARSARNYVEDEMYDRSRQEIPLGNRVPSPGPDAWLAPNAVLIGDTDLAVCVSIWHGAVLKGDLGAVRIGAFTNVGEKVVIDSAGYVSTRHITKP